MLIIIINACIWTALGAFIGINIARSVRFRRECNKFLNTTFGGYERFTKINFDVKEEEES